MPPQLIAALLCKDVEKPDGETGPALDLLGVTDFIRLQPFVGPTQLALRLFVALRFPRGEGEFVLDLRAQWRFVDEHRDVGPAYVFSVERDRGLRFDTWRTLDVPLVTQAIGVYALVIDGLGEPFRLYLEVATYY